MTEAEADRRAKLEAMIAEGMTFAECMSVFESRLSPAEQAYGKYATAELNRDGDLEADTCPMVSSGDLSAGAYVLMWKWVDAGSVDEFSGGTSWREDAEGVEAPGM